VLVFDVLGDPVRRRILELIASGEMTAGAVTEVVQHEFGISQPAVSQHLRVLRESGFTTVRADGNRRLYAVNAEPLQLIDSWLEQFRHFWDQRLDALATEIKRGRRERRQHPDAALTVPETGAAPAAEGAKAQRRRARGAATAGTAAPRADDRRPGTVRESA
jgi:DNA-binding transcriptional ArsR family regulator